MSNIFIYSSFATANHPEPKATPFILFHFIYHISPYIPGAILTPISFYDAYTRPKGFMSKY